MNSGLVVNQKSHMKREIRFGFNVPISWKTSNSIYYMNLPLKYISRAGHIVFMNYIGKDNLKHAAQ